MEERKSNKKTRAVIIVAMILLILAIIALCGTTFAKYITSKNVTTSNTTVAKWGFVVNANADGLFGAEYSKGSIKTDKVTTAVDVKAGTKGKKTLAPGTGGSMKFSVSGTAEVDASITIAASKDLKDVSLTQGADVYNPIKWVLKSSATVDGTYNEVTDVPADAALVKGTLAYALAQAAQTESYKAGATAVAMFYELSWEWALEVADDPATDSVNEKDEANKKDTILGYAAMATETAVEYGNYSVVKDASGVITVTDMGADGELDATSGGSDDVVYTAVVDVNVGLTITVEQTQAQA